MSVKLEVRTVDLTALAKQFSQLGPKLQKTGINRSIQRTMIGARTQVTKYIREGYFIKSADVKSGAVVKDVKGNTGSLTLRSNRISLSYFGVSAIAARRKRAGVRVRVAKGPYTPIRIKPGMKVTGSKKVRGGSNKVIPGSFAISRDKLKYITGMRGEGYAIFVKSKSRKSKLRQLYGPSVSDLFGNGSVINKLSDYVDDRFRKELNDTWSEFIRNIAAGSRANR